MFNDGYDDASGNYVHNPGEEIAKRYIVRGLIGKGSFGIVLAAYDSKTARNVAIKIIKNRPQFYEQAKIEVGILSTLNKNDPRDEYGIGKC